LDADARDAGLFFIKHKHASPRPAAAASELYHALSHCHYIEACIDITELVGSAILELVMPRYDFGTVLGSAFSGFHAPSGSGGGVSMGKSSLAAGRIAGDRRSYTQPAPGPSASSSSLSPLRMLLPYLELLLGVESPPAVAVRQHIVACAGSSHMQGLGGISAASSSSGGSAAPPPLRGLLPHGTFSPSSAFAALLGSSSPLLQLLPGLVRATLHNASPASQTARRPQEAKEQILQLLSRVSSGTSMNARADFAAVPSLLAMALGAFDEAPMRTWDQLVVVPERIVLPFVVEASFLSPDPQHGMRESRASLTEGSLRPSVVSAVASRTKGPPVPDSVGPTWSASHALDLPPFALMYCTADIAKADDGAFDESNVAADVTVRPVPKPPVVQHGAITLQRTPTHVQAQARLKAFKRRTRTSASTGSIDPWFPRGRDGPFLNMGYSNWCNQRLAWRGPSAAAALPAAGGRRTPRRPLRDEVVQHIIEQMEDSPLDPFDLIQPVNLKDMVEVLSADLWDPIEDSSDDGW
jgi:hypothetical protein